MADTLHEKLMDIQQNLKVPKDQNNTFGEFKYRSIEDIEDKVKPFLAKHKLTLTFEDEMVSVSDRVYVKATAILSDGKDTFTKSAYAREAVSPKAKTDDAQLTGACSSYARKYAASGLFLIDNTKDADATSHSDDNVKKVTTTAAKPQKATIKQIEMLFTFAKERGNTDKEAAHKWLSEQMGKDITLSSSAEASKLIGKLMKK